MNHAIEELYGIARLMRRLQGNPELAAGLLEDWIKKYVRELHAEKRTGREYLSVIGEKAESYLRWETERMGQELGMKMLECAEKTVERDLHDQITRLRFFVIDASSSSKG